MAEQPKKEVNETHIPRMKRVVNSDRWYDIAVAGDPTVKGFAPDTVEPIYMAFMHAYDTYGDVDFKLATREGIIYGIVESSTVVKEPAPVKQTTFGLYGEGG